MFRSIMLGLGLLLAGDLTLSRLHYHYQVHETVTVPKLAAAELLKNATADEPAVCALAESLSRARGAALESARQWHPVGKFAAEFFDHFRGHTTEKRKLGLAKKTCAQLVESSDKTNNDVNLITGSAGILTIVFMALLLKRQSPKKAPQWPAQWKRKLEVAKADDSIVLPVRPSPLERSASDESDSSPTASFHPASSARSTSQSATQQPAASQPSSVFTFQESKAAPLPSPSVHSFADLYSQPTAYTYYHTTAQAQNPFQSSPQAAPQASFQTFASAEPPAYQASSLSNKREAEEEIVVMRPKRRNSVSAKEITKFEAEPAPPKTPRRSSSKTIVTEPESTSDWSPLTVESVAKSTGLKPTQMMGGLDVGAVVNTPRRRSANAALGSVPSVKRTRSGV